VLGLGSFAGTFQDGAGRAHGLISVIADDLGLITLHVEGTLDGREFFESNLAGSLVQGMLSYSPITAAGGIALVTSVTGTRASGQLQVRVAMGDAGRPANRFVNLTGTLGAAGGTGTFTTMITGAFLQGTFALAPGRSPDAGPPRPVDAGVDSAPPRIDAGIDAAPAPVDAAIDAAYPADAVVDAPQVSPDSSGGG
jgi:hypothetical protein